MMPLDQNPFFEKYLQAIDFIAADNQQKAAEERADQRYNERLNEQRAYSEEQQTKAADQQEFQSLTEFVQEYPKTLKAGAEPDPDLLKSAVTRRNALIEQGAGLNMFKNIKAPQIPEKSKELYALPDEFIKDNPKFEEWKGKEIWDEASLRQFGITAEKMKETERHNKAMENKKSDKGGLTFNFGGQKMEEKEIDAIIQESKKSADSYKQKGGVDNLGVERPHNAEQIAAFKSMWDNIRKQVLAGNDVKIELNDLRYFNPDVDWVDAKKQVIESFKDKSKKKKIDWIE